MSTFLDAVTVVQQDFINRTNKTDQVRRAINTTINHYSRERFQWNETQTVLAAVAFQETLPLPADFLMLDRLEYTWNSTSLQIIEQPLETIRMINCGQSPGVPQFYQIYGGNFYLANVPDSAYPMPCFYVQAPVLLSADTDTSPWLDNAFDLVVAGAAKLVWARSIRNASAASICAQLESDYASELRAYRDQNRSWTVTPTDW